MVATKLQKRVVVAYVPVVHQGYVDFFKLVKPQQVWLIGREFTDLLRPLQKDIRALDPASVAKQLTVLLPSCQVNVWSQANQPADQQHLKVIMPDELVSRAFAQRYLSPAQVRFASVFLRWDSSKSLAQTPVKPDHRVSKSEFDRQIIAQAKELAIKSADWWRQVGAVLVKNDRVLLTAYNHHLPGEQQPYIDGDPRADFHQGEYLKLSTAIHAEADLIAQAAKQGIAIAGASLYVTTFPCPVCAKLVAAAGIKRLYYLDGYSVLDGEQVLKAAGVALYLVV